MTELALAALVVIGLFALWGLWTSLRRSEPIDPTILEAWRRIAGAHIVAVRHQPLSSRRIRL